MCYNTLDTDGEKTEPPVCQHQDILRTSACIITGKIIFPLCRAVWRYLKNALQNQTLFELCPLFDARECKLNSDQGIS